MWILCRFISEFWDVSPILGPMMSPANEAQKSDLQPLIGGGGELREMWSKISWNYKDGCVRGSVLLVTTRY